VFTLTPTATDRDLFDLDRTYGMDFAYMDEMDVLIEYLNSIYSPSDSNSLGLIYSNSDPYSKVCKEYLLANCGGMFSSANIIDAEVAWDAYDGKAAKQLAKCKNVVVLYQIDYVTVSSLASDIDYIKTYESARIENFISLYTFYDFSWGIVWDPRTFDAKILMPFDIMAENGDFADFREKYSDFHYSDAMVALGYDAVYAIYEALLVAVENGEEISADLSAGELGEILDGVFASGFVFDALTGGDDGRGTVTWNPDGRVKKELFPVTISSHRK
jgi:hypothetical protein